MKQRLSRKELVLVAGAVALGCFLRWSALEQLAVEHFDEGVYSSTLWYGNVASGAYPSRHLYAPPALPELIAAAGLLTEPQTAPFLPGLLAGSLTIVFVWGFTRAAFGQVAGLLVVMLAALSDFHILYSRMALTDVPCLMWIVLAVWIGITGIHRDCLRTMAFAGVACGCAWWTKYSGWLPLAIVSSGSAFWWIIEGRRDYRLSRLIVLNLIMTVAAVLVWCPWLWALQGVGGYGAVSANHSGYVSGWSFWQKNLATQITWHKLTDSWLAALAIGLGVTFAGCHRWFEARCSTWNRSASDGTGVTASLLARFLGATVVLCIATLTVGSFAVMTALGAGGITGMFLWPVSAAPRSSGGKEAPQKRRAGSGQTDPDITDEQAAAALPPRLGASVILAWFCGLLLTTPLYTPYPRLFLPLVAVIWIAAAAGIGWWMEACISVARRSVRSGIRLKLASTQLLLGGLVLASVSLGISALRPSEVARTTIHDSRLGLRDATSRLAELCREAVGAAEAADPERPQFIVYGFGEPAVVGHLNLSGVIASPVQDLTFPAATLSGRPIPTFFVFGPNALRTPGFMYDWIDAESRFEHVGDVFYDPSAIVLYNLYAPDWLQQHPAEERRQRLEVYRLK